MWFGVLFIFKVIEVVFWVGVFFILVDRVCDSVYWEILKDKFLDIVWLEIRNVWNFEVFGKVMMKERNVIKFN